jgi:predicted neutral ceramidase superfamily lipid hydrolase
MTVLDFRKLVNKYAIILIVAHGLVFLVRLVFIQLFPESMESNRLTQLLIVNSSMIIHFIINIIAALLVISDSKKLNINNNVIIIATLIYSLLGVSMFLLLANHKVHKVNA